MPTTTQQRPEMDDRSKDAVEIAIEVTKSDRWTTWTEAARKRAHRVERWDDSESGAESDDSYDSRSRR
jgi:hypothetical protein